MVACPVSSSHLPFAIYTHRAQRSLSFADELGRELHEIHMSHNTQYSNRDRRHQPVDCCVVS